MKRKLLIAFLSVVTVCCLALGISACGEISDAENLEYTLSDDGTYYTVSGIGACTDTDLVIPSRHKNLPVTAIGEDAFSENGSLTSVTLPASVTYIGDGAFRNCSALASVTFADGSKLETMGGKAFYEDGSLTKINLEATSLTAIEKGTFAYCTSLTSIIV